MRRLAMDHDHKTGFIRGLLCHQCNVMLGAARDNVAVLASAIRYLQNAASDYAVLQMGQESV